jgi:hypothetical protein
VPTESRRFPRVLSQVWTETALGGYQPPVFLQKIRIYGADSGTLSRESFVDEAFRKYAGKECIGVYQPKGCSDDGGIVVKAGPYYEDREEQPEPESCLAKEAH